MHMKHFICLILLSCISLVITKNLKTKECLDYYRETKLCVEYDDNDDCIRKEKKKVLFVCQSTGGSFQNGCECYPQ